MIKRRVLKLSSCLLIPVFSVLLASCSGGSISATAGVPDAPTPTSAAAVSATAQNNSYCTAIQPFYWEIGDANEKLVGGSSTQAGGKAVTASSPFEIASASKWIYAMYVVQQRGGVTGLTSNDIKFLNFTSGYSNMPSKAVGQTCTAPSSGPDSINYCLTLSGPDGPFDSQDPNTVGKFDYNSGHEENHAGKFEPSINALDASKLGKAIADELGVPGVVLYYNQPLLAGGIYTDASSYAAILRAVLSGQLYMHDALGTHTVCAWVGAGCNAVYSPVTKEHWHYSLGHWVEDDTSQGDDGAFSSPGLFGFDPWIDAQKKYYGVISRFQVPDQNNPQPGYTSTLCARRLRAAWETGKEQ